MPHYALSDEFRIQFEITCLDTLIPKPKPGDVVVPVFTGTEQRSEALSWLTIFSQWALQQGMSADHTLEMACTHLKSSLNLDRRIFTWTEFVRHFFKDFNVGEGESRFLQWYWSKAAKIRLYWFSYRELKTATGDFSERRIVGRGKVRTVYQGFLPDVQPVVVKRLKDPQAHSLEEVLYEVYLHRSLPKSSRFLRLVGYCSCEQDPLLVYEYVSNGTLEQHLNGQFEGRLTWDDRITVAIDIADAVTHLHYNSKFPIYHRSVKSSNILIDSNRRGKLADFGIAAAVSHEKHRSYCHTKVKGSRGYTDPHYARTGKLTDTTDVYSFGVVLMELVTGLKAGLESRTKTFLPSLVSEMAALGLVTDIVDSYIWRPCDDVNSKEPCEECLKPVLEEVINLAIKCCNPDPSSRPKIKDVADILRRIKLEQFCMKKPKTNSRRLNRASHFKELRDAERYLASPSAGVPSVNYFSPLINLVQRFFRLVSTLRPYSLCRSKACGVRADLT